MTTNAAWLVAAMLLQGAMALALLGVLGSIRLPLVQAGQIRISDIALSREPWPVREKQVSNAFDNQFQLPVLFYLAGGLALYFGPVLLEVVLGWMFLLSRIAHAAVFATSNNVTRRFAAYTMGYAVLVVFWIDLLARLAVTASHPVL